VQPPPRAQEAGNGCAREAGIQIVAHELSHFVNATNTPPPRRRRSRVCVNTPMGLCIIFVMLIIPLRMNTVIAAMANKLYCCIKKKYVSSPPPKRRKPPVGKTIIRYLQYIYYILYAARRSRRNDFHNEGECTVQTSVL
jgi:hypothetical protein